MIGVREYEPQYNKYMFNIYDIEFEEDCVYLIGDDKRIILQRREKDLELTEEFREFSLMSDYLEKHSNRKKSAIIIQDELKSLIVKEIQKAISHFIKVYNKEEGRAYLMTVYNFKEEFGSFFINLNLVLKRNIQSHIMLNENSNLIFEELYYKLSQSSFLVEIEALEDDELIRDYL